MLRIQTEIRMVREDEDAMPRETVQVAPVG
jgi:hypothetical protein